MNTIIRGLTGKTHIERVLPHSDHTRRMADEGDTLDHQTRYYFIIPVRRPMRYTYHYIIVQDIVFFISVC